MIFTFVNTDWYTWNHYFLVFIISIVSLLWKRYSKVLNFLSKMWTVWASSKENVISLEFQLFIRVHLICFSESYYCTAQCLISENDFFFVFFFFFLCHSLVRFSSLYFGEELNSLWRRKSFSLSLSPPSPLSSNAVYYVIWKIKTLLYYFIEDREICDNDEYSVHCVNVKTC